MQSWRRFPASREPHLSTQVLFTIMSILSAIVHAGSVEMDILNHILKVET